MQILTKEVEEGHVKAGGEGAGLGVGMHTHHRVSAMPVRNSCLGHSLWPRGWSAARWWPGYSREAHHRSPGGCQGTKPSCRHPVHIQSFCSSLHGGEGEGSAETEEEGSPSRLSILLLPFH